MRINISQKKLRNTSVVLVVAVVAALGVYTIFFSQAAAPNCTTTVSSTAAAQTALSSASAGSTICMSNGTYGKLTLNASKTSPGVTVRALNPGQSTIAGASVSGSYITLAQFDISNQVTVENNSHHITIFRNNIYGGYMGVLAGPGTYNNQRIKDVTIKGNKIVGPLGEDGIRANQYGDGDGDGNGLLIEGNEFTGIRENGNHSDCLQTVWVGDHLVYRYNYLHDNRCQGFFVKDHGSLPTTSGDIGTIDSIKVENNLFTRNNEPCAPEDPGCGQPMYFQVFGPVANLSVNKNTIWGGDVVTTLQDSGWGTVSFTNNALYRIWSGTSAPFGNYTSSNNIRANTYNGSWPTTGFSTNDNPGFPAPTLAGGDDFRLGNGIGVTWKPGDCIYGPTDADTPNCPWTTQTPSGQTANLWIDTNGGSCTRQVTAGAYNDATACSNIQAAYNAAANAGDTVMFASSQNPYGRQSLAVGTKTITISGQPDNSTTIGTFTNEASNVTLKNVRSQRNDDPSPLQATFEAKGNNNTYDNVHVDSKNILSRQGIYADGTDNTFKNSSTYNVSDEKAALIVGQNLTFDKVDFYNAIFSGTNPEVHMECVYAIGANGLTIRNSRFWNCAVMDLYLTRGSWYNAPPWGNVTIENNIFEHSTLGSGQTPADWHYYGVVVGGALSYDGATLNNYVFRNNTFENAVAMDGFTFTGTSKWVGNIGGGWSCLSGMTYKYNVGTKCSATDKTVSPASSTKTTTAPFGWLNPGNHDFHLSSSSPAINAGDPTDYPATDADGTSRPNGSAPDAGAYEYVSSGSTDTTPPDTTITSSTPTNGGSTTSTTASVSFTGTDNIGVTSFECSLDSTTAYTTCTSPKSYTSLTTGSHTIRVRAKDAAGNTDASPASITFTVTSPSTCSTLQGDANDDGVVNISDISTILALFGQTNTTNCADVTKDQSINIQDISLVLANYGNRE